MQREANQFTFTPYRFLSNLEPTCNHIMPESSPTFPNGNVTPPHSDSDSTTTRRPQLGIVVILRGLHLTNPTFAASLFTEYTRANCRGAAMALAALALSDDNGASQTMNFLLGALNDIDRDALNNLLNLAQTVTLPG